MVGTLKVTCMDSKEFVKLAMAADLRQTKIERIRFGFARLHSALYSLKLGIENQEKLVEEFIADLSAIHAEKEENGTKKTVGD